MATPSSIPHALTGDMIIDAATNGFYWQLDGSRTINWALAGGFFGEYWVSPQTAVNALTAVFDNISSYANVHFHYAGSYTDPSAAYSGGSDITISLGGSNIFDSNTSIWAVGLFPNSFYNNVYQGAPGDVFANINSQANYLPSYAPGSAGYALAIHEIGHTLGLKHPFDDGGTGHPTLTSLGLSNVDEDWFTVMAYNDDYNYNLRFWDPATPMALDVLALQYLYGPNLQTNATNSSYSLLVNNLYQTIWDAGGTDVVDVSGSSVGWSILLPNYQLSSLVTTKVGAAIPLNELSLSSPHTLYWLMGHIENATGSAFNDRIEGNSLSNTLNGGLGNDTLDGGAGVDTAAYAWLFRQHQLTGNPMTSASITGPEGTDSLSGIERLQFVDGSMNYDPFSHVAQVTRLYEATLGRLPDPVGLNNWVTQLDAGVALSNVALGFTSSIEFQNVYGSLNNTQFVNQLYLNVLHRAPDSEGLSNWVNFLNAGTTRGQVVVGFSESQEDVNNHAAQLNAGIWDINETAGTVARLYWGTLQRAPDAQGLVNWVNALNGGMTLGEVASGFTGSIEFQNIYGSLNDTQFVNQLYLNVLERPADAEGLANWINTLDAGASRGEVTWGFTESQEYQIKMVGAIDQGITIL